MKNKLIRRVLGSLVLVSAVFIFCSCGGGGGGGTPPAAKTTIAGKLVTGSVGPVGAMVVGKAAAAGEPLVGYQLYCVTFATSPLSASGTSGTDGSVTLTFDVESADLGCFILDATGNGVATLIFVNGAATEFGQTVKASGSVDFGTITVSLSSVPGGTGAAQATVPSGVTIDTTTPTGASCPVGSWYATGIGHSPNCPTGKDTETAVWIVKQPDGTYAASFTSYNVGIYEQCTIGSKTDIPLTLADNVATFTVPFDFENPPYCSTADGHDSRIATVNVTVNADCTTGTLSGQVTNCGSCDPAPCIDCGTLTCPITGTVTRK